MVGFIERHRGGERAILVHIDLQQTADLEQVAEFKELARASGVQIQALLSGRRDAPTSHAFIGKGKLEELVGLVQLHKAEVVIFNHSLSPAQARNLEKACCCKVIDRTELILDIFASRAKTFEGRLQVELAQLKHLSTRLVRGWTHLERQKGGIGLRGPGETQLETDRRLLAGRVKYIQARLQKVHARREQGRRRRHKRAIPTVALVGYTNAGKSTLYNALTAADVYANPQLFATLDPTYRELDIAGIGPAVLIDTVGFIRQLPHDLVEAFKATLEEASMAQLICHVIDVGHPQQALIEHSVNAVLSQIGAQDVPQLVVYNKIDLAETEEQPRIVYDDQQFPVAVYLSAATAQGMDLLMEAIAARLAVTWVHETLTLPYTAGQVRAWLYAHQAVVSEQDDPDRQCWRVDISLAKRQWQRLQGMLE